MRKILPLAATLLALTACTQTPTPTPSPTASGSTSTTPGPLPTSTPERLQEMVRRMAEQTGTTRFHDLRLPIGTEPDHAKFAEATLVRGAFVKHAQYYDDDRAHTTITESPARVPESAVAEVSKVDVRKALAWAEPWAKANCTTTPMAASLVFSVLPDGSIASQVECYEPHKITGRIGDEEWPAPALTDAAADVARTKQLLQRYGATGIRWLMLEGHYPGGLHPSGIEAVIDTGKELKAVDGRPCQLHVQWSAVDDHTPLLDATCVDPAEWKDAPVVPLSALDGAAPAKLAQPNDHWWQLHLRADAQGPFWRIDRTETTKYDTAGNPR